METQWYIEVVGGEFRSAFHATPGAGRHPYVPTPPECDGAHEVRRTGLKWLLEGETVTGIYEIVARPPEIGEPPRRWSRLTLRLALAEAGLLATAESALAAVEVAPGYSALRAFGDCDYIEEGWPTAEAWSATVGAVAAALGKTAAEAEAFLAGLETEARRRNYAIDKARFGVG